MRFHILFLSLVAVFLQERSALAVPASAETEQWSRFRGPNGTGISHATNIPTKITEAELAWKTELPGTGHSSPVLWGQKVFLTATGDKAGGIMVLCLNAADGKIEWSRPFPLAPFQKHAFNSFASATPAADAERVYVAWNEPEHYYLTALNHQGKTVWRRDFGALVSQHGSGTSPIVCDDKVILADFQDDPKMTEGPSPGAEAGKSSIIAVNAKTGKTVWQTARRSTVVCYSTPCLFEPKGGARVLICNSQSHGFSALAPDTGQVLWEVENVFTKRTVSSPVLAGDFILGSCGSGGGGNVLSAINAAEASPAHQPALAFQIKKAVAYVPTSLAVDGLVWMLSDAGILTCFNARDGGIKYQERVGGNFFGSPIWIAGRLYCVSKTGELVVVEASDTFNVLHRFDLHETCESTPAVGTGKLLVRTAGHLWAFGGGDRRLAAP